VIVVAVIVAVVVVAVAVAVAGGVVTAGIVWGAAMIGATMGGFIGTMSAANNNCFFLIDYGQVSSVNYTSFGIFGPC
jgi:hypothetical protein